MSIDVVNEDEIDNEANYLSNRSYTTCIFFAFGADMSPNISSMKN